MVRADAGEFSDVTFLGRLQKKKKKKKNLSSSFWSFFFGPYFVRLWWCPPYRFLSVVLLRCYQIWEAFPFLSDLMAASTSLLRISDSGKWSLSPSVPSIWLSDYVDAYNLSQNSFHLVLISPSSVRTVPLSSFTTLNLATGSLYSIFMDLYMFLHSCYPSDYQIISV